METLSSLDHGTCMDTLLDARDRVIGIFSEIYRRCGDEGTKGGNAVHPDG